MGFYRLTDIENRLVFAKGVGRCRMGVLGVWDKQIHTVIHRRRQWHPTPVLLPGKSHGWRSLVGCTPQSCKESDTTERFHFHFSLSCTGKGNGNPLQHSCLENPRDGGAWWAAVSGVAQSGTRLKQRSSRDLSIVCGNSRSSKCVY